jgi:U4/U6.U5 tri-snRNP-associated protein 1
VYRIREAAALRDRIAKSKGKRILQNQLDESTLAEVKAGGDSGLGSAADWVQRSRQRAVQDSEREGQKRAAEQQRRRQDEEDELLSGPASKYSSSDLKGLRVMHGAEDFEAGEEMILTLADSSVLSRDERGNILGVNEEADVLENINVTEEYKRQQREERKKKATRGAYSGYDDEEFAEGVAPKTQRSILSQYDKEKEKGPRMVLSSSGVDSLEGGEQGQETVKKVDRIEENLASESKALADYLTPAEFASFNKPKKEKKMRKIRKKDKEEDPYADLVSAAATDAAGAGGDRGSRSAGTALGVAAAAAQADALKRAAYDETVQNTAAKNALMQKTAAARRGRDADEDADDDLQISTALARARTLALQTRRVGTDVDQEAAPSAEQRALLCKRDMSTMAVRNAVGSSDAGVMNAHRLPRGVAESKEDADTDTLDVDVDGRDVNGTLYFTDTTEFTSRLQARLFERDREKADAAFKEQAMKKRHRETAEGDEVAESSSSRKAQRLDADTDAPAGDMDIDDNSDSDGGDDVVSEEEVDEDNGFGIQKPMVERGLAATLAMMRGAGDLHKKEELAGRIKDSRDFDPSSSVGGGSGDAKEVNIEYRDKQGRKLTQKEAFRQLSYRFHGIEPSRKKKEKTLKVKIVDVVYVLIYLFKLKSSSSVLVLIRL